MPTHDPYSVPPTTPGHAPSHAPARHPARDDPGDNHAGPHPAHAAHDHVPIHYARSTGRKLALFAIVVALALAIGFLIVHHRRAGATDALDQETLAAANAPPEVSVVSVQNAPGSEALTLPGETRAWYQSTIYARVNGYVDKWLVDIGDHVTKGQVLATIETPELDLQLKATQAKLKASDAQVEVAQAAEAFARSTNTRWADSPKGVVSEQEREEKKAAYESAEAQLDSARAQVALDQSDVNRLLTLTNFKTVVAPYDGIITARRVDIGDLVTAGSSASTSSLYTIAQSDKIRVFVDVPQSARAGMTVGIPAVITARAYLGRKFEGAIARTADAIDPASRTLRVEADIPNPDLALLPGMYVEVGFQLPRPKMVEVRASALIFLADGPRVAVVGNDDRVKLQPITIAHDEGAQVEISSGLQANQKVALNLSSQIADGDRVTPVPADAPQPKPAPAATPVAPN